MSYTEDQIKQYLEILRNYNIKEREGVIGGTFGSLYLNVVIVEIVHLLLLILDTKSVIPVGQLMVMY